MQLYPLRRAARFLLPLVLLTSPAFAANDNCKNDANFNQWLDDFRKQAADEGVSAATIRSALGGMAFAPDIIARDRGQKFFAQTFLDFSGRLATAARMNSGRNALAKHKAALARAETEYGIPPQVIVAFWALESDFGVGMGKLPILRSLTTLAYDCRRPELFRPELMAALKIIDRGDMTAQTMIGSWAGEIGQTQFLPTLYLAHAVDGDGDGKIDLMRDAADVIISSAKYIADLGWKRGEPWLEEVRAPAELPWDQADLAIAHQRGKWAEWGVTKADGSPLQKDGVPASLLLPMGRNGPAFLAYANFKQVYLQWNQSLNYATTAAYLATRLAGASPMRRGNGAVASLSLEQAKELQRLLTKAGHDVGKIDGTIGAGTRAAVKAMQQKFGLPADSYPTPELLAALGGSRAPPAAASKAARVAVDDTPPAPPAAKPASAPAKPKKAAAKKRPPRQEVSPFGLPF